jgi:hypothetical protein
LEYNSTDQLVLEQTQVEIKYILQSACVKLHDTDNSQGTTPAESFVAVLPCQLLNIFSSWPKTGMPLLIKNIDIHVFLGGR